jgi:hypothetical protein
MKSKVSSGWAILIIYDHFARSSIAIRQIFSGSRVSIGHDAEFHNCPRDLPKLRLLADGDAKFEKFPQDLMDETKIQVVVQRRQFEQTMIHGISSRMRALPAEGKFFSDNIGE